MLPWCLHLASSAAGLLRALLHVQWQEAYPNAILYACPGLQSKKPDVKFDYELNPNDKAPPAWKGEVECACLSYERNPFTGKPFFNEVRNFYLLA